LAERAAALAGMAPRLQRILPATIDPAALPPMLILADQPACGLIGWADDGAARLLLPECGQGALYGVAWVGQQVAVAAVVVGVHPIVEHMLAPGALVAASMLAARAGAGRTDRRPAAVPGCTRRARRAGQADGAAGRAPGRRGRWQQPRAAHADSAAPSSSATCTSPARTARSARGAALAFAWRRANMSP
jgi:hypothetical protein